MIAYNFAVHYRESNNHSGQHRVRANATNESAAIDHAKRYAVQQFHEQIEFLLVKFYCGKILEFTKDECYAAVYK